MAMYRSALSEEQFQYGSLSSFYTSGASAISRAWKQAIINIGTTWYVWGPTAAQFPSLSKVGVELGDEFDTLELINRAIKVEQNESSNRGSILLGGRLMMRIESQVSTREHDKLSSVGSFKGGFKVEMSRLSDEQSLTILSGSNDGLVGRRAQSKLGARIEAKTIQEKNNKCRGL